MPRLALVGGPEISRYTVADKMWALLSEASGIDFTFDVSSLESKKEVAQFYKKYLADPSFIGFNVALPWKAEFAKLVDQIPESNRSGVVNTVYKKTGVIVGDNTDPLGIERGLGIANTPSRGSVVLILGGGGGGQSTAQHVSQNLKADVYLYDISDKRLSLGDVRWISSINELASHKYDLIINATPLGKYYFDRGIDAFSSPLDAAIMDKISHETTIVQEMNYMPIDTLFLQIGRTLGLLPVSGERMLVFQAIESLKRYFDINLDDKAAENVIKKMRNHILKQESVILNHSNIEDSIDGRLARKV